MWHTLQQYGQRKVLESKFMLSMMGLVVETLLCGSLETVLLGSVNCVLKAYVSPWTFTDIVVIDVGLNVLYIICACHHVRTWFHTLFKHPCRLIGRKILGLDVRNTYEYLKLKYTLGVLGMVVLFVATHTIVDLQSFIRLVCAETLLVHLCVDGWKLYGTVLQDYVDILTEPKPLVRKIEEFEPIPSPPAHAKHAEHPNHTNSPEILGNIMYDSHF